MANVDNAWGDWEDDDDDDFVLACSQLYEEEKLQMLKSAGSTSTGGPSITPNLAAQAFNSRRETLNQNTSTSSYMQSENIPVELESQIQFLNKQCATEKSKAVQLSSELYAAKGESTNLRRQVEKLKHEQQEELCGRLKKEQEDKQRHEDEKREYQKKLSALQTQLREANNHITRLETKNAHLNANRSIGGAIGQSQQLTKAPSVSPFASPASATQPAPRHKSDPNLRTNLQQRTLKNLQSLSTSTLTEDLEQTKKAELLDKEIQANASVLELENIYENVFDGAEQLRVSNLEDLVSLKLAAVRREIFETTRKLVHLEFINNTKNLIDSIVVRAPKEIMARFTRGIEIKTCFPDLVENMFLYGIQAQRRKENERKGDIVQKKYPKLKSGLSPQIIDMDKVYPVLESHFVYDSAWLALKHIKTQFITLLSELSGENRFRLYEFGNLKTLWELLVWTRHLWKYILFEEEFEDILSRHGRDTWIEELKTWTGLILKIDWRDFYVPELEKLVRGLSLSILEIIVTTGYFDSSQRRYEILYCILKDTLLRDHLRTEQFLRRCLNIITWSISDSRNILNYLCINNNDGNCLARVLGDNVLKCFIETKSPYKATNLLLCYFHLLESLMIKHTPQFFSTVARPPLVLPDDSEDENDSDTDDESKIPAMEQRIGGTEDMDVDNMCSQFACSEKYKFEDGSSERAKRFNNVTAASCWINPEEWEIPIAETLDSDKGRPCQCRKILLGSTFVMLYRVVQWWKDSFVKREKEIEKRETIDAIALEKLKVLTLSKGKDGQIAIDRMTSLSRKLTSLQNHIIAAVNKDNDNDAEKEEDDDKVLERTWDVLIKAWNPPNDLPASMCGNLDKLIPTTIFDMAMRTGILLMHFCNFHSENIALAAGSEAFNCFTLLVSEAKVFEKQPCITEAEKRFLKEIIRSGEDDSEIEKGLNDSATFTDDDEEDEASTSNVQLPDFDEFEDLSLEGFPDDQLRTFSESEFDRAFQTFEREINSSILDSLLN